MYFVFVVNPIAGGKEKQALLKRMESAIRISKHDFIKAETTQKGDAEEFARVHAEKYGEDCVIVSCGGDGTMHEIVNGMAGTQAKLLILPLGTGNDFAKKIYNTKKPNNEVVMKRFGLLDGNVRFDVKPIDLIDVDGRKCANVTSFGLDTRTETVGRKLADRFPWMGSNAYNVAVGVCLFGQMKFKMLAELDIIDENGQVTKTDEVIDYTLMAICNGSYYGGGYCPAPDSKLDDGILDLCYVDAVNVAQALPLIPYYSKGTAAGRNRVHTGRLVGGRISSADGSPLKGNYDGENFSGDTVTFRVEEKALQLCVFQD